MDFEWDGAKADANWRKHRVLFETARRVFADPLRVEQPDDRYAYGEARFSVLGTVGNVLLRVTFTPRGDRVRLISARRATPSERLRYERR